jgi:D-glycero-D-manno-heptose 1,7-bisphosphate phosphatase
MEKNISKKKTVFIDRDGVINIDSPDYIKNCDEFEFIPGSTEAFRKLNQNGYNTIIITNQSVIGRKMVSAEGLNHIFTKLKTGVHECGGMVTDIFFCPHIPEDHCCCRKPKPGMILSAEQKHGIDLSTSYMIGDSAKDIECAKNAKCGFSILVKTGNGMNAKKEIASKNIKPDYIADDLLDAVNWILKTE